jgi:hypothetical protein
MLAGDVMQPALKRHSVDIEIIEHGEESEFSFPGKNAEFFISIDKERHHHWSGTVSEIDVVGSPGEIEIQHGKDGQTKRSSSLRPGKYLLLKIGD